MPKPLLGQALAEAATARPEARTLKAFLGLYGMPGFSSRRHTY